MEIKNKLNLTMNKIIKFKIFDKRKSFFLLFIFQEKYKIIVFFNFIDLKLSFY